jgi:hypothetical protein
VRSAREFVFIPFVDRVNQRVMFLVGATLQIVARLGFCFAPSNAGKTLEQIQDYQTGEGRFTRPRTARRPSGRTPIS